MSALAYAWWVVALPPFSGQATAVVLLTGLAAAAWGARRRRGGPRRPELPGVALWAGVALVAAVWELAAYLQHPRVDHPTLSSLTNALLDSHPARAVGFVLWAVGSRELARR